MAATIADCRPVDQRYRHLHRALEAFHGSKGVIQAIDLFGIQSTARLDQLMQQATGYLSRFFDSHLIADGGGRILFEAEAATSAGTEVDESHVATPAFSSHVDISELLRVDSPPSAGALSRAGDEGDGRGAPVPALSFRGRSFVEMVRVQDIELRAFVHPFILDGIDVSGDSERTGEQVRASSNGTGRPTFYMVGIVDNSEFESAAIKLRLSFGHLRHAPSAGAADPQPRVVVLDGGRPADYSSPGAGRHLRDTRRRCRSGRRAGLRHGDEPYRRTDPRQHDGAGGRPHDRVVRSGAARRDPGASRQGSAPSGEG